MKLSELNFLWAYASGGKFARRHGELPSISYITINSYCLKIT